MIHRPGHFAWSVGCFVAAVCGSIFSVAHAMRGASGVSGAVVFVLLVTGSVLLRKALTPST